MNPCVTGAREYIDYACPYADCGYIVTVPNVCDIYICPGCDSLVLVIVQRAAIRAGT